MKITISILIIVVFTFCAFGQVMAPANSKYVEVSEEDGIAVSELLPMPMGMSPNLSDAKIGIKYFGVQNESEADVSFILILKGTKNRYSGNVNFGVKAFSDTTPLSRNKYRMVQSVQKDNGGETLKFALTTEEVAWLATGSSVKFEIYNHDTDKKYDTVSFTTTGFAEYKMFVKSVLLIRSFYSK